MPPATSDRGGLHWPGLSRAVETPRHRRGPRDVENGDEDDSRGEEQVLAELVLRGRQEARRVAAERL